MSLQKPLPTCRWFFTNKTGYLSFLSQFTIRAHEAKSDFTMTALAAKHTVRFFEKRSPELSYAVSETLKEVGGEKLESDPKAKQLLEKELMKECKELSVHFKDPFALSPLNELLVDLYFSKQMAEIGRQGAILSQEILTATKSWSQAFWKERKALLLYKLWADPNMDPLYCRFLKLFAEVVWKERSAQQFEKSQKQLPAMTQSVYRPLIRILSPCAKVSVEKGGSMLLFEGKIIAKCGAVDPILLPLIEKGIKQFSSIYHHKLLRFLCAKGFENWVEEQEFPNKINIDGGAAQLAEDLGFKFKEAPLILKAILHAQAYMDFTFDDGSQRSLIELRKYRSPTTKREEGLEITLAEQLMPSYTFQTTRQRKLLVPLPHFPPFFSAPQYHSGQSLLQMIVMEEFTNRSVELAQYGSIEISERKWEEFLHQTRLPLSVFRKIYSHWLTSFLTLSAKDRYTLSEEYQSEKKFLLAQGALRKERQRQGKISVRKRQASLPSSSLSPISYT